MKYSFFFKVYLIFLNAACLLALTTAAIHLPLFKIPEVILLTLYFSAMFAFEVTFPRVRSTMAVTYPFLTLAVLALKSFSILPATIVTLFLSLHYWRSRSKKDFKFFSNRSLGRLAICTGALFGLFALSKIRRGKYTWAVRTHGSSFLGIDSYPGCG